MIRRTICASLVLVLAGLCVALAQTPATMPSVGLAGNWKWDFNVQDQVITWTATFKQDGERLTGSAIDSYDNTKMELKNVKVDKDSVTFTADRTGDFEIHFSYSGKLDGDKIIGKCETKFADADPMPLDWNAKRMADTATTKPTM
jgi:hypothetical protein